MKKMMSISIIAIMLISGIIGGLAPFRDQGVTVTASNIPGNTISTNEGVKQKTIYLHNTTGTVFSLADVLTMNTTMGESRNVTAWENEAESFEWALNPVTAGNMSLNGNATFYIWAVQKGGENWDEVMTFTVDLYDVDGAGSSLINSSSSVLTVRSVFTEYSISMGVNHTLESNHTLRVVLTITHPANREHRIGFGNRNFPSRLVIPTSDYIKPVYIGVLNHTYQETANFNSSATNKTIHFNATVTDPFGGYDIWNMQLSILDSNGTVYHGPVNMTRSDGGPTSFVSNFTYSWDYGGAPEGEYTVVFMAIDQTGFNYRYPDHPGDDTYGGHIESVQKIFWIGEERFQVHFKAVDSIGAVMANATVEVRKMGVYVTHNLTDADGIANISLKAGSYNITVYWQDIAVNTTDYDVTMNVPALSAINLNCSVYYPIYRVVDVAYENVDSANLYIGHPNGSLAILITGTDGTVDLPQMAVGKYIIRTEWLGKEVNTTEHDLVSNGEIRIDADIFYLTVTTIDSNGATVPDVLVTVEFNDTGRVADSRLTDAQGNMTSRLPGTGTGFGYDLTCNWHGVYVGSTANELLLRNESVNVTLDIYYIDFHTVDSMGLDLEYTRLLAFTNDTGSLANTAETNITGDATMRLPGGNHTIEAYWKGVLVGTYYIVVNDTTGPVNISCNVYHVTFNLTDGRGMALENAQLVVFRIDAGTLDSNVTNSDGEANARLPGTNANVVVQWRGAPVYSSERLIDSDGAIDIQCEVYYLSVLAVDDAGQPLEGVSIEFIYGDTILASDTTGTDGTTGENRLPGANLGIRAYWKGVQIYDGSYLLDADGQAVINTTVYLVDIEVIDSMNMAIPGASVDVYHDGVLLFSGLTGEDGMASARLPGETHNFHVMWGGVLVFDSDMLVNESGTLTIYVEDVYHVTFRLLDSRSENVTEARVTLEVDGVQIASGSSDANGLYRARIPTPFNGDGDIDITVVWKGIQVYDDTAQIGANHPDTAPMDISVAVYYLDYSIIDQRGKPVEGVVLTDIHSELPIGDRTMDSGTTDSNGHLQFRLPGGVQTLESYWKEIMVNSTTVDLVDDMNLTCNASIYYLEVNVVDIDGKAIDGPFIRVVYPGGDHYLAGYADNEGFAEFRIPASDWVVEITWFDAVIYDEALSITDDEDSWSLDAVSSVYYLTVRTVAGGESLSGVHIVVRGGDNSWSGYTESGEFVLRLPGRDDYKITARLKTTYMLSGIDLEENLDIALTNSAEETVSFETYPPSTFSTNLFLLVFAFVTMLFVLVLLYHKLGPAVPKGENEGTTLNDGRTGEVGQEMPGEDDGPYGDGGKMPIENEGETTGDVAGPDGYKGHG